MQKNQNSRAEDPVVATISTVTRALARLSSPEERAVVIHYILDRYQKDLEEADALASSLSAAPVPADASRSGVLGGRVLSSLPPQLRRNTFGHEPFAGPADESLPFNPGQFGVPLESSTAGRSDIPVNSTAAESLVPDIYRTAAASSATGKGEGS